MFRCGILITHLAESFCDTDLLNAIVYFDPFGTCFLSYQWNRLCNQGTVCNPRFFTLLVNAYQEIFFLPVIALGDKKHSAGFFESDFLLIPDNKAIIPKNNLIREQSWYHSQQKYCTHDQSEPATYGSRECSGCHSK